MQNRKLHPVDVAIIGAGPFGLSLAAHFRAQGIEFRIFGSPMHTWLNHMPQGMKLKSEGFASSLFDPDSELPLAKYCADHGLPYADIGLPVPLETFAAYGLAFQNRFVPNLEKTQVTALRPAPGGFELELEDGEKVCARKVIVAVGISHYAHLPEEFAGVPKEFLTHSFAHSRLEALQGREVAVIGAGASALDLAALLHRAGASVQLISRAPAIRFHDPPTARPLLQRLRYPMTGIGPGWKMVLYAHAPALFHSFPEELRLRIVRRTLGPAPGWFVRDQVEGKVPFHLGVAVRQVRVENDRVRLQFQHENGDQQQLLVDHVIAATGYRVDLEKLKFLDAALLSQIRSVERTPVLSLNFESSVPGLYFVGASSANSHGPLVRFAVGAGYTAARLSAHLSRRAIRTVVPGVPNERVGTVELS